MSGLAPALGDLSINDLRADGGVVTVEPNEMDVASAVRGVSLETEPCV